MRPCCRVKFGVSFLLATVAASAALLGLVSCGTAPTAFLVNGPGGAGNVAPTLTITQPTANVIRGQGAPFVIEWVDSDPDNNAQISFDLINTANNSIVPLISGIAENDQIGPDSQNIGTALIPIGSYNLRGTIDDSVNPPVEVFATVAGATGQRVLVQIVGEGQAGTQNQPPSIAIAAPTFDLSVAQDDVVQVTVVPSLVSDRPYDVDDDVILYIVFDTDLNPNNDDPANPDPTRIVVLDQRTINQGVATPIDINIAIDLSRTPPRPGGAPYFIRATIDDGENPRVHQYSIGTANVTQLAAGLVDLAEIGKTLSGSRFYGFNPGANFGSTVRTITDFDGDGVDDFIMVAQFGNPRNAGLVGEAYLVYGQPNVRFGGTIAANSVSATVPGVLFEAPPVRPGGIPGEPVSNGITDVNILPDFTADGRPELIFGLSRTFGAFESMDFDPSDQPTAVDETTPIEVVLRQGLVTVQEGDGNPVTTSTLYAMEDTVISTVQPGTILGSSASLSWRDDEDLTRKWALIKFPSVLNHLPDDPFSIDVPEVQATLELRVFDTGGQAAVHEVLTDFNEQTTYNDFNNGEDPEPGVDFFLDPGTQTGELENVDAADAGVVEVDVSPLVRRLLDGLLSGSNDEIRLILVPTAGNSEDEAGVRSSEFTVDRPLLRIQYERLAATTAFGCYPDLFANNAADTGMADPFDVQFFAGGMAVVVNSTNRDNDGPINTARLDSTVVTLELAGQRNFLLDANGLNPTGGEIFARADNSTAGDALGNDQQQAGRIAGARFVSGFFDFEDHLQLRQPARDDLFGQTVGLLGDIDNDGLGEIVISAPRNELYGVELIETFGFLSTHFWSTTFEGSVVIVPGRNYFLEDDRERQEASGTSSIPWLDHTRNPPGSCQPPVRARSVFLPAGTFEVFAENVNDMLGGAGSGGDFNQDGLDDLLCGAYLNDRPGVTDSGAVYVLYARNVLSDFFLAFADDPIRRAPMLRIRGLTRGDQIGWKQTAVRDVNGDRLDDILFSSPRTDFGGITRSTCGEDFDDDGVVDQDDFNVLSFNQCQTQFGNDVFLNEPCKSYDYDNDGDIDADDRCVFCCLSDDCDPEATCVFGRTASCCESLVDNGFVGVAFGGRFIDGDRSISQLATSDLPGAIFFGGGAGHRAGVDISSAGDFNQDGFGDFLIAVPGETRRDSAGRLRVGIVYLVFGGTHLENTIWNLSDPERGVGSAELPGIVFMSPYVAGRPNEAAPVSVGLLGDINNDGFDDIAIGNPRADFIDLSFPQGPEAPGSDAGAGRRRDAGDAYIIYGSNFGSNSGAP